MPLVTDVHVTVEEQKGKNISKGTALLHSESGKLVTPNSSHERQGMAFVEIILQSVSMETTITLNTKEQYLLVE